MHIESELKMTMCAEENNIFINRELSWLEFNRRVLDLAKDKNVPLAEQFKFAAIYASNLDEFFMIRVGSLYDRTLLKEDKLENKTNMTAAQQLAAIIPVVLELQQHCDKIVQKLFDSLEELGCQKVNFEKLAKDNEHKWKKYFINELSPVLSPQIIDKRHPFPFLRNNEMYVGAMLKDKNGDASSFGLIPISNQFERIVYLQNDDKVQFALVEEMIMHFADLVFGKGTVQSRCVFRVTRNADITVDEGMFDHDIDYRVVMSELLKKRRKLAAVRLQTTMHTPEDIVTYLCEKLFLPREQVCAQTSPLDLSAGFRIAAKLAKDNHPELFYPVSKPMLPPSDFNLAQVARQQDVLLFYPYQSMRPFIKMLSDAANDPDVISIKMTLYRVARESKIIEALIAAAENGKEVVTIVELRARFDEQNNIDWSKQLENAGCTVIYGFADYKVHSKLTLITSKKDGKYRYIAQIGTGNYNEKTSEQYTDISYITSNQQVAEEVAAVFNNLAVERLTQNTQELIVAPLCFKSVLMHEIDEEIAAKKRGEEASLIIKCNSISDREIIEKISEASCAEVIVDMVVRGICCIKAGVNGYTDNVHVHSIVGRYLEHSRIYAFGKDDRLRIYIASGDFLTRNTERRVEVGVKINNPILANNLYKYLLIQLNDNVNTRMMLPDGSYVKVKQQEKDKLIDSQGIMYDILKNAWPLEKTEVNKKAEPILKQSFISKMIAKFSHKKQ
ncbi:MAG: polyphosphate kinase 1 [Oscillospiraceae bacterium]